MSELSKILVSIDLLVLFLILLCLLVQFRYIAHKNKREEILLNRIDSLKERVNKLEARNFDLES